MGNSVQLPLEIGSGSSANFLNDLVHHHQYRNWLLQWQYARSSERNGGCQSLSKKISWDLLENCGKQQAEEEEVPGMSFKKEKPKEKRNFCYHSYCWRIC